MQKSKAKTKIQLLQNQQNKQSNKVCIKGSPVGEGREGITTMKFVDLFEFDVYIWGSPKIYEPPNSCIDTRLQYCIGHDSRHDRRWSQFNPFSTDR